MQAISKIKQELTIASYIKISVRIPANNYVWGIQFIHPLKVWICGMQQVIDVKGYGKGKKKELLDEVLGRSIQL